MDSSSRTLVCSVLFLDIVEYSKKPVAEQLQLKQEFNRVLGEALEQVPARDRIILDTGDGAAVTFMGDPEDALFAALAVREAAQTMVRLGVNLGPVRLVKDLNGQMNIIGDGINVAQRVMSFASPGQILVSRSFYEVVSCLSRDYANLFRHEGARTDKHIRAHEVYSVIGGRPPNRRLGDTLSETVPMPGTAAWLAAAGPYGLRRSALAAAAGAFSIIVATAAAARALLLEPAATLMPPATRQPTASGSVARNDGVPPRKIIAYAEKRLEPKQAPPSGSARIELAVLPWGEVFVDGTSRGVSPPLRTLDLAPGAHTVEIRNSTFPAHVEHVEVNAGEAIRIRHRFR